VNTSEKGIALIKYFEGVLARPYKCPGGYWTVGVGHLITRNAELPDTWNRKLELDEIDELLGLKLGADDFIKKSGGFSIKVLIERIRVQLRKKDINNNLEDTKNIISHGKLKLDPSQLECEWDNKQLPDKLTTTEFLIVKELAKRPGIIKERAQLMDIAYREDTDIEDRTIDSHVKRIRKKFKKVDPDFTAIETRYGSGYRWNVS